MKKLFIGIAATALAAAMCVSFAACGETPSATDAKDVQGYEVTAEQWNAAFEALAKEDAEFTITGTVSTTCTLKPVTDPETNEELNGGKTDTTEYVFIKKGDKEYGIKTETRKFTGDGLRMESLQLGLSPEEEKKTLQETNTTTWEAYAERTSDGCWTYEQKDGKWTKEESSSMIVSGSVGFMYGSLKLKYEDYTYSEEDRGYIPKDYSAEDIDAPTVIKSVIKFDKDGKLIAIYVETLYESELCSAINRAESVVFEYSAKEITLPTVEEE